jgi:serine/threonine protein kinase
MTSPADPCIGTELAGFRIEALIGRGAMGVVCLAEWLRYGRKVALKVVAPELATDEGFRSASSRSGGPRRGSSTRTSSRTTRRRAEGVLSIAMHTSRAST